MSTQAAGFRDEMSQIADAIHVHRSDLGKVPHRSLEERRAMGREARQVVRRRDHAGFTPAPGRPDPVDLLLGQAESRLPELVPLRHARMATSEFAFFRGTAIVQAADLGAVPHTSLTTQLCGDAHLSNFGLFASPDRRLVFDVNDFDETLPGPFEWDVKRLAASFVVAGRDLELPEQASWRAALESARAYRELTRKAAELGTLDIWYARIDADRIRTYAERWGAEKRFDRATRKAMRRTSEQVAGKLTEIVNGRARFVEQPPVVRRVDDIATVENLREAFRAYRETLSPEMRTLLERYRFVDIAFKVVGVGSVGTRVLVMLLQGRDVDDPLVLQVKEAQASVLEPYLAPSGYANQGERVVNGQRLLQAASDVFLGWIRGERGDFYWRQMRDWKHSADISAMSAKGLRRYATLCGHALARAHARAGDPVATAAYLGKADNFEVAIADYAEAYADQVRRDYRAFLDGIESGRVAISELA